MSNRLKALLILAFGCIIIFNACEEPLEAGRDIIPDGDALVTDTIETLLVPLNTISDSVLFSTNRTSGILGAVQSNIFGNAYAGLYTETGFSRDFDTSKTYIFDSIVLYLRNTGYTGDSLIPQTFNIFELTDTIPGMESFTSQKQFAVNPTPIGTIVDKRPSSDSTRIGRGLFQHHFSAKLDDAIGQSLLTKLESGEIMNDSSLQENFKGIYIEPVLNSNARGSYNVEMVGNAAGSNASGVHIFYRTTDMDTLSYILDFQLSSSFSSTTDDGTRFFPGVQNHNRIWNDVTTAEATLQNQLDNYDPNGYDQSYVRGGNGLMTLIELPDTKAQLDGFQINRAELIIEGIVENLDDTLFLPTILSLNERFAIDSDGELTGGLVSITGDGFGTRSKTNFF